MEYYFVTYEYKNKIRLGNNYDGGYVIADLPGKYDCYLSCGVNNEESFTRDFLSKFYIPLGNSFAFDGTIDRYPYKYTTDIFFMKKNIDSDETSTTTNLKPILEKYSNIFLKMDIEGGEYKWLNSDIELSNIKQLVIEFHGTLDDSWNVTRSEKNKAMEKILETHTLIHCHANNYGTIYAKNFYGHSFPSVIECTFIRNDQLISKKLNTDELPVENIDFKNNINKDEIKLNFWPFVKYEGEQTSVPKKIFQTYKCEYESLDKIFKDNIENIKRLNPNYEYRYFSDSDCEKWVEENYEEDVIKMYKSIKIGVAKSDFFRYLLIYKEGGIYLDIKSSVVYPIDYILQYNSETILNHWEPPTYVSDLNYTLGEFQNWFLIYTKEHEIIENTIKRIKKNLADYKFDPEQKIKDEILRTTGPIPYSLSVIEYLNKNGRNKIIEHNSTGPDGFPSGLMYSIYIKYNLDHTEVIKSYDKISPII